jgi:hypothetical protein
VYVAKCSDELWVGVKCQSNSEIACSPRNVFRYSREVTKLNQTPNAISGILGVRQRGLSSVVKRESAQTIS